MITRYFLSLLLSLALLACIPKEPSPPLVEKVPFKVLVHFSSQLPNPYYVLSGPFMSYQRFAVNDAFQNRLETYAAAKSDPLATQTLELSVHVISLQTSYDRLGGLPEGKRQPGVRLAGLGWRGDWPLSTLDSRDRDGDGDLPEQITKTATLQTQVTIKLPDRSHLQREIIGRSIQILEREDMGLMTHDYSPLIAEVQASAIDEIDRLLDQSLRQEVSPPLKQ